MRKAPDYWCSKSAEGSLKCSSKKHNNLSNSHMKKTNIQKGDGLSWPRNPFKYTKI